MSEIDQSGVEQLSRALFDQTSELLKWEWDSQFETILAEFSVDIKGNIMGMLRNHLSDHWDSSTIKKAHENVKAVARNLGGLRNGQLLFTSDTDKSIFMFGAWWPWGDEQTISLRVAPCGVGISESMERELIGRFQTWRKLTDRK